MLIAAVSPPASASAPVWCAPSFAGTRGPGAGIATLLNTGEVRAVGPVGMVSVGRPNPAPAGTDHGPTEATDEQRTAASNRRATLLTEIEALRLWQRGVGRPTTLTWIVKAALDRRIEELARLASLA